MCILTRCPYESEQLLLSLLWPCAGPPCVSGPPPAAQRPPTFPGRPPAAQIPPTPSGPPLAARTPPWRPGHPKNFAAAKSHVLSSVREPKNAFKDPLGDDLSNVTLARDSRPRPRMPPRAWYDARSIALLFCAPRRRLRRVRALGAPDSERLWMALRASAQRGQSTEGPPAG
jgi:hypothetical protein